MVVFRTPSTVDASDYIRAASAAGADSANIAKSIFDKSPEYDTLTKQVIKDEGLKNIAGIKKAGKLLSDKQEAEFASNLIQERNKQRIAGKLAARAKENIDLMTKKDPPEPFQPNLDKFKQILENNAEQLKADWEKIKSQEYIPLKMPNMDDVSSNTEGLNSSTSMSERWGRTIRFAEGTERYGADKYNVMFGGGLFSDLSKHPNTVVRTGRYNSAAAGAYQFMPDTFARVQRSLQLPDFGKESQEKAFRYLADERGVDVNAPVTSKEDFRQKVALLSPEWASLPTLEGASYHGQPVKNIDELLKVFVGEGYEFPTSSTNGSTSLVYKTGNIGPTNTGIGHLDIKQVGRGRFELDELTPYIKVEDPEFGMTSLKDVRVKTNYAGDSWDEHFARDSHGIDVGTYPGTSIFLTGGARKIGSKPTEFGDLVTIELPNGQQYTLLHGKDPANQ